MLRREEGSRMGLCLIKLQRRWEHGKMPTQPLACREVSTSVGRGAKSKNLCQRRRIRHLHLLVKTRTREYSHCRVTVYRLRAIAILSLTSTMKKHCPIELYHLTPIQRRRHHIHMMCIMAKFGLLEFFPVS